MPVIHAGEMHTSRLRDLGQSSGLLHASYSWQPSCHASVSQLSPDCLKASAPSSGIRSTATEQIGAPANRPPVQTKCIREEEAVS
jgi:hypothetical protein